MSLLNQVLHDLDERASAPAPQQLKLAPEAPAGPNRHTGDFAPPPSRDWLRILVWSGTAVVSGLALWSYLQPLGEGQNPVPGVVSQFVAIPAPTAPSTPATPELVPHAARKVAGAAIETRLPDQRDIQVLPLPSPAVDERLTGTATETNPVAEQDLPATPRPAYVTLRNTEPEAPPVAASALPVAVVKSDAVETGSDADRAREAIDRGDLAESELLLKRHLERFPRDIEARELLIGLVLRGDRHVEALPQIDRALALSPKRWSLHLLKARLLLDQQRGADARELLQLVPAGVAQRTAALQMLGALEQQAGRYAESRAVYRELVALTPLSGAAWAGLAISLDSLGDAEAASAFRRALKIGGLPEPAARYARGRLLELGVADE
ncbi:MAG: tetratricopeptide repeat protein [Gammaproteobacteria bacterium]|nr:tetratricopeptide repeat protein [Gammaproteobacteria bacterium]